MVRTALLIPTVIVAILSTGCADTSEETQDRGGASSTIAEPDSTAASGTTAEPATTVADPANAISNVWQTAAIDPAALPIGDGSMSNSAPGVGIVYSCVPANPNAPGAHAAGPWLDEDAGTWDSTAKLAVEGALTWPNAEYSETVTGATRSIESNGLPVNQVTGAYPIATTDPAYEYDRNPGNVGEHARSYELPVEPSPAAAPACLPMEAIGIMRNGVVLYNALDGRGDDAAAHEVLDVCNGHPSQISYHYHSVPGCVRDAATGPSTVVGWALDGYPIVVERDADGNLPSNADLDECHGRTSPIALDGEIVTTYHYSATLEYPYTVGCFHGTQ